MRLKPRLLRSRSPSEAKLLFLSGGSRGVFSLGFDAEYTAINLLLLLQSPSDGTLPLASHFALPLVLIPLALSTIIWPAALLRLWLSVLSVRFVLFVLFLESWHRHKLAQLLSLLHMSPLALLLFLPLALAFAPLGRVLYSPS